MYFNDLLNFVSRFHELQIENSLLSLARLYDDTCASKPHVGGGMAPPLMGRTVSSLLGKDQLEGMRGVVIPSLGRPPSLGNSVGLPSSIGSISDLMPPPPERQPSMWRQQSLEYFGSCVESMMMMDQVRISSS